MLRQVNVRTRRPGFRDQWPRVVTTLTDPAAYPAGEVAALFGRRWQVEVYFRDLKRTLGMHRLRSRTAAGVRKELAPVLTGPAGARSPCNTVPA
ncbi:MAG TPA: transposase [Tepidisphaeraceae bacterium]|nr:transposase [Tepidisphaeraceae bacterium]